GHWDAATAPLGSTHGNGGRILRRLPGLSAPAGGVPLRRVRGPGRTPLLRRPGPVRPRGRRNSAGCGTTPAGELMPGAASGTVGVSACGSHSQVSDDLIGVGKLILPHDHHMVVVTNAEGEER